MYKRLWHCNHGHEPSPTTVIFAVDSSKLPVRERSDLPYKSGMNAFRRSNLTSHGSKLALELIMKTFFPRLFGALGSMCTLGACGTTWSSGGWYTSQQAAAGAKAYITGKAVPAVMVIRSKAGWRRCLWASRSGKLMGARRSRLCGRAYTDRCR
jgi:hypothetical protein